MSGISNFMFGPPVVITTSLRPEECSARCAELTVRGFFGLAFSAFSSKPVMGEVDTYDLRWRRNSLFRTYFYQAELRANFKFAPDSAGTRAECNVGGGILFWLAAILMPCLMLIWFLFVFVTNVFSNPTTSLGAILVPHLIFLAIFVGVLGFGVVFARRDRDFLLGLLHRTIGGQMLEVPEDVATPGAVARRSVKQ